jgi:hypothetical protein
VAMACPIIPSPKNATRISGILLLERPSVIELDMSGRSEVKQLVVLHFGFQNCGVIRAGVVFASTSPP